MRYLILILFISLIACSKKTTSSNTIIKDSTIIKEIVRLDTIHIQGDSVILKEYIECDSITNKPKPFKASGRSGRASAKVIVSSSGELQVKANCDSLLKIIEIKDKEIIRLREEISKTVVKDEPTKFKIWIDYSCRIITAVFILYILFNVFRSRTRF